MSETTIIDSDALPAGIRTREQWVCWREEHRDGKPTKIPVTPSTGSFASSTDPDTWAKFATALEYAETGDADGVGFVFTEDDPYVGVDLDDCRDPESEDVDNTARDIIKRLDSFTEISPSGTGYHVLTKGDLPDGRNRKGSVELYDNARFFTVTGDHVDGTPSRIAHRQDALVAIHSEYIQDTNGEASESGHSRTDIEDAETDKGSDVSTDLTDEELIEKATNASNGAKFERLWNGHTGSYESQSEADMALCCMLAFWTGGEQTQMDRLFRQSGLIRPKWDEVHYADGSTYGEKTIERAIANTSEFYDPDATDESNRPNSSTEKPAADEGSDSSERTWVYLTEKNRLLADRVDELEARLEQKNERIDQLEAEIERLTPERTDRDRERQQVHEDQSTSTREDNSGSETASIWRRTKQLFESD
ncbi:hypothetical protein ACFQDG_00225 [Natronoarchaeum mannanilyticum]|uniref:NrS-1 polymerase-like HBD domain-containing protein n=1 Tax=Natronoarchaeum mannanilyticum TaxID=926360 RepID=A0AAV3TF69_9EURY